jgi:hypothetical protein
MPTATDNAIADAVDPSYAELAWRLYPHTFTAEVCPGRYEVQQLGEFLGEQISDAIAAGNARIIINVAPRQGKSETVDFATFLWFLEHFPHLKGILATHTASLSLDYGRRVRNEFQHNPLLTTKLSDDSSAANQWNTPEGGGMKTVGVGGGIVGFGGDLIVVDDPHKNWAEAHSLKIRKGVAEWFDTTLMSRVEPGGSVIVVMQRLHPDDLTGHLLKNSKEKWNVIVLPALAGKNDPMGRAEGEPVAPERYDQAAMESIRDSRPRVVWETMYQQNPEAGGDGRAYSSFQSAVHVKSDVTLRHDLPLQLAWDFNKNPGTHCLIGQCDRRADLFTVRHELFGEGFGTPETLKLLKALYEREGWMPTPKNPFPFGEVEIYGDRSGNSENSTVTTDTDYLLIRQAHVEWGIPTRMKVPAANPPIKTRVMSVNDAFRDSRGDVHYHIHPSCERLLIDYREVHEGETDPIDKSDHALTHPSDAEGYRIHRQRPIRIGAPPQPADTRSGVVN